MERYCKAQGMLSARRRPTKLNFTSNLKLDMSTVQPSLAGPKRPQDRIVLTDMQPAFQKALTSKPGASGFGLAEDKLAATSPVAGSDAELKHGSVVIAAITSCTNTSNPSVMIGAGLLARKANARGLKTKPYVKTSLAPGSRVVTDYLEKLGLDKDLEALGFFNVGLRLHHLHR